MWQRRGYGGTLLVYGLDAAEKNWLGMEEQWKAKIKTLSDFIYAEKLVISNCTECIIKEILFFLKKMA